ncbi:MAG: hypothetical protein QF925_06065, partial [Dehalococcoidia bacterium]|nr:hypothetical protein [Dehalococcoidia bacterium]
RLSDGKEVDYLTDPLGPDTDADDLIDGHEIELETDPHESDTDLDRGFTSSCPLKAGNLSETGRI